jgi:hypothetical protein
MSRTVAGFKRLSPAYKAIVGLVAPIGTIVATLLALNVIQPFGEDAFAAGVDRTTEAGTAAIALRYESRPETGAPIAFSASGAFDYRARRGVLRYDFSDSGGAGALRDVEVRFADRDVYLKLPGAGDWVHADLDVAREQLADYAEATGRDAPPAGLASIQELDFNDPSQVLARLRSASAVEELGEETVFGVTTKKYRAAIKGDQPFVASAWIDGSDLIRRLELVADKGPTPFTMTMEFSDFGEPVDVRPPAAEDVQELSDLLERLA